MSSSINDSSSGERLEASGQEHDTSAESAKHGLEEQLRTEQARSSALEQEKASLTTANATLEANVKELEQQLTEAKTRNNDAASTVIRDKATINGLTAAVQYLVTKFANQAADSQDFEKIFDLLTKPQIAVSTMTRVVPMLIFCRTAIRAPSASAPFLLWIASRHGSLDEVFEHAEGILNTALDSHTAQAWWIVDALERLASRMTSDIKVAMLLLQGVAYVLGLIPSYSPDSLMHELLEYIDSLTDGFIVRSMYQKVLEFFEQGQPITSWLPSTVTGVRMLDHSNSALADDVQLFADKTGTSVLNRATNAGIVAYVFEKGDIESLELGVNGEPLVRMKSAGICRVPQDMQYLQLALAPRIMDAQIWMLTFLSPL